MKFLLKFLATIFITVTMGYQCSYDKDLYKLNLYDNYAEYSKNKFCNYSKQEFRKTFLGLSAKPISTHNLFYGGYDPTTPIQIDWSKTGAVTGVKDQGACGSCWAFSATGDMEGTAFTKFGVKRNLSEQNLVDCVVGDFACQGGLPSDAFDYVIQNGIQSEFEYKYTAESDICKYNKDISVFKIDSWVHLPENETLLASYVYQNGPVSIGINANLMQFYDRGIITNVTECDPDSLDHGVLIVGYGEYRKIKYWKVKNSWGDNWGEHGYFRIIRGKGACGLNKMVTHSIANTTNINVS